MSSNREDIKAELKRLVKEGQYLLIYEAIKNGRISQEKAVEYNAIEKYKSFVSSLITPHSTYQTWYSKSIQILKQILPDRLDEFKLLYINPKRGQNAITHLTYSISDYYLGLAVTRGPFREEVVNGYVAFSSKMSVQTEILNSALNSLDSKLMNIEAVLLSEIFESELETAKDILKKKHVRLAGALAGITLEIHLKKVCINHNLVFRKQNPTISDFNEELKKEDIIDVPTWRLVQRLADIRNLCAHSKEREPKIDEVQDLISGTEKLIAELY